MEVEEDEIEPLNPEEAIEVDNPDETTNNELYSIKMFQINQKNYIISGGGDDKALIWDIKEQVQIELTNHKDSVIQVEQRVSKSNGKLYLLTASMDGTVKVFKYENDFSIVHTLEGPSGEIEFLALHPTQDAILVGSSDGTVWIWDFVSGECLNVLTGHENAVTCGSFTPNGKRVLTSSADSSTRLWSPARTALSNTGNIIHTFKGPEYHVSPVVSQTFAPSATNEAPIFATGSQNGVVIVAKLDDKRVLRKLKHSLNPAHEFCSVEGLEFCKNQSDLGKMLLVSGATDGICIVWDWIRGNIRQKIQIPSQNPSVTKLFFELDTFNFFVTSTNGDLLLIESRNGEVLKQTLLNELVLDIIVNENKIYLAVESGLRIIDKQSLQEVTHTQ